MAINKYMSASLQYTENGLQIRKRIKSKVISREKKGHSCREDVISNSIHIKSY